MCFERDAAKGKLGTKKYIAPVLKKIGGGEVVQTEGQANSFERWLDFHSIDGVVSTPKGLLPFAARCQYKKNYQSFSIRYSRPNNEPTEYEKISKAIETNSERPYYHAQAFVIGGQATVAITHTDALFHFMKKHWDKVKIELNEDGTKLAAVFWRDLEKFGVKLKKFLVSANGSIEQI